MSDDDIVLTFPSSDVVNAWAERLNAVNRAFWKRQAIAMTRQLANPLVRGHAFAHVNDDLLCGVPIALQRSIEHELDKAELYQNEILLDQARRGGRADKRDALQRHIDEIMLAKPLLTCRELLAQLRQETPGPLILEISDAEDEIVFAAGVGDRTKTASLSGLRQRHSRARQKNKDHIKRLV